MAYEPPRINIADVRALRGDWNVVARDFTKAIAADIARAREQDMTSDPYDMTGLDYGDDVPDLFPVSTAQPSPRQPLRVRMADRADEVLRSPRWDQVRGLVLLSGGVLIAGIIVAVAVLVFLAGGVLVVRSVWEGIGL